MAANKDSATFPNVDGADDMSGLVDEIFHEGDSAASDAPAPGSDGEGEASPAVDKPAPKAKVDAGTVIGIPDDLLEDGAESGDDDLPAEDPVDEEPPVDETDLKKRGIDQAAIDAMKAMRQRIGVMKKELAQKSATAPDADSLAKIEALETQVERANFVKSPRFDREYRQPILSVQEQIIAAGKDYGLEEATITRALQMGRVARTDLLAQEISNQAGLSEILPLFAARERLMTVAQKALQDFQTTSTQAAQQEAIQTKIQRTQAISAAETELRDAGFMLLKDSTTNPQWLPSLRSAAEKILDGSLDPKDSAKAALRAVVADHQVTYLNSRIERMSAEMGGLRTQLGKYVKLEPRPKGGTQAPKREVEADSIDALVEQVLPG